MRVKVNGEELEVMSYDIEKGEAILALLDADGNQALQPDGTPDTVCRRGIVELIETTRKKWSNNEE